MEICEALQKFHRLIGRYCPDAFYAFCRPHSDASSHSGYTGGVVLLVSEIVIFATIGTGAIVG